MSESLSSFESQRVGNSTARPNFLIEVHILVHNVNLIVTLVWTPSRIGITRYKLADTLAGIGNQKPNIKLEVNLELQEAYSLVDKHILDLLQQK